MTSLKQNFVKCERKRELMTENNNENIFEEVSPNEFESAISAVDQTFLERNREYIGKKCYLNQTKTAGYCLMGEYAGHFFSTIDGRNMTAVMLTDIVRRGGTWGMALDGPLVKLYEKHGLEKVYECPASTYHGPANMKMVFVAFKNSSVRNRPEVIEWMKTNGTM